MSKAHLPHLPRNVDSDEQLVRSGSLHPIFQEADRRGSCALTDVLSRRPAHQITASLVGHNQGWVIDDIKGVGQLISVHHWEGRDAVVLGHSVRRAERVLQSNRYTIHLRIECGPYQTIAG